MNSTKLYYNNTNLKNKISRLDVAIQNRLKSGKALSEFNRQVQLEIPQPPAMFKSAEEEVANASFQNSKAVTNLMSFMYYNDATNALSDLIKNNEVVEFNNFYEQFKKAIGSRFLSYYEFAALWDKFKEKISDEKSGVLSLEPEKKILTDFKQKNKNVIEGLQDKIKPRLALTNYNYKKSDIEDMDVADLKILLSEEGLKYPGAIKKNTSENREKLKKILFGDPKTRDRVDMGAGLKSQSISGGSLMGRYNVLKGEINAGNNNPNIYKELKEIKKKLF